MALNISSIPISNMKPMKKDRKESQIRERRRQCELERRPRIFNAKARKIGVDVEFLNRQVQEKQELRNETASREQAFLEQMQVNSELLGILQDKEKEEKRRAGAAIDEYRLRYQRPEDRREFDLNDPHALKKQLPARASDNVGLASAQKFEGEDLASETRSRIMAEQRIAWMQQQLQERNAAREERRRADAAYMEAVMARDARSIELDKLEKECRHKLGQATLRFNQLLAQEKDYAGKIQREEHTRDGMAEIYNHLTSDMLTENRDVAKSALGMNRTIGFMYKGMTDEEVKKFREGQKEQRTALKEKRESEQRLEEEWQAAAAAIQRDVRNADLETERVKRKMAKQMMADNYDLMMQQKEKEKHNKMLNTSNQPTEEYYAQFNKGTR